MTKAVLFDFDETLQDRTAAFEKYMDTFLDTYCPGISKEEKELYEKLKKLSNHNNREKLKNG
mgnify:CR=1 FL=1